MAIRKIFSNDLGKELSAYVTQGNKLFVCIKDDDATLDIILSEGEAIEFIMELYRMKKELNDLQ